MSETFREPTPAEVQMTVLQFMGQHLTGDLKELDRNLVSRNNTLAGMTLNPDNVIRSIPVPQPPQALTPPVQQLPPVVHPQVPATVVPTQILAPEVSQPPATDQNQLEFNFNSSPYTERVFEKLESLERKLQSIIDVQAELVATVKDLSESLTSVDIKKKDS